MLTAAPEKNVQLSEQPISHFTLRGIQGTAAQDTLLTPAKFSIGQKQLAVMISMAIVGLFALCLLLWRDQLSTDKTLARADLRFATVVRADLRKEIAALGKVVVANSPTLYSSADGIVTYAVKAGDAVTKNQVLLSVDSPSLLSKYQQAKASLAKLQSDFVGKQLSTQKNQLEAMQTAQLAELGLQNAKRDFERYKIGFNKQFISLQEYERAEEKLHIAELKALQAPESVELLKKVSRTEIQAAKLQVTGQQAVVDELAREVDTLIVRSPVEGMVGNLTLNQNSAAAMHQALITVIDLSHYEVEIEVPEHYAPDVAPAMTVDIQLDGQHYTGAVTAIAPEIQAGQVKVRLHFTGQEPQSLRQNQRINASIFLAVHKNVLRLPRGSYLDGNSGKGVFKVQGHKAYNTPVEFGASGLDDIEVLQGLQLGDEIISSDTSSYRDAKTLYLNP